MSQVMTICVTKRDAFCIVRVWTLISLDELHQVLVQVDQQVACVRVPDQQGCLQPHTLLLDALEPCLVVQGLKFHQCFGDL